MERPAARGFSENMSSYGRHGAKGIRVRDSVQATVPQRRAGNEMGQPAWGSREAGRCQGTTDKHQDTP